MAFSSGATIYVPCDVQGGPFSEYLISFETVEGPVTGFVSKTILREAADGKWSVEAKVLRIQGEVAEVLVSGSFFNTNGLAHIRRDVARAA